MAVLRIHTGDIPILRQSAKTVDRIDERLHQFIEDMFETMYAAEGIGLAAPQVGVSQRIIIADIEAYFPDAPPIVLINPAITKANGERLGEEGCLSLPGIRGIVRRAETITVEGLLTDGNEIEFETAGLMARVLQHESDHLNGILFTDLLRPEDQELLEESELE